MLSQLFCMIFFSFSQNRVLQVELIVNLNSLKIACFLLFFLSLFTKHSQLFFLAQVQKTKNLHMNKGHFLLTQQFHTVIAKAH